MGAIHFYHLTTTPLERALPKLMEKCYGSGERTLLLADEDKIERLNELLWTYDQDSFLPHGSAKDGNANAHPIFLVAQLPEEKAGILCITNGTQLEDSAGFSRVIDIFDGNRDDSLQAARARWKQYKDQGVELSYLQQTGKGGWEKKA